MNEFNDLKPKAELSVSQSAEALTKSQNALNVANGIDAKATNALSLSESADTLSKSVQEQFNQVVIDGDSSVEAAQARVDASGQTNPTLKARLDKEHNEVTAQLAQTATQLAQTGVSINRNATHTNDTFVNRKWIIGEKGINTHYGSAGTTRIIPTPIPFDGKVNSIDLDVGTTGDLKLKRFTKNGDVFSFVSEVSVAVAQTGRSKINVDLDVNVGEYIGIYSPNVTVGYYVEAPSRTLYTLSGDISSNASFTPGSSSAKYNIQFSMDSTKKLTHVLLKNEFTANDPKFILNGFTLNDGLKSPVTGGTSITGYWDYYTTLDQHKLRAVIQVDDTNSEFALIKKHDLHGGVGLVDCQSKKLRLFKAWTGSTLPAEVANIDIPFEFVAGRKYLTILEKYGSIHTVSITDMVTGLKAELSYDNSKYPPSMYAGKQWGSPGVMFLKGDITVKKLEFIVDTPSPEIVVMGDSITEGITLDNGSASYEDRYGAKLRAFYNGNVVISGRGSGNSSDLIERMDFDLLSFSPEYVFILIGTNDAHVNTWKNNIIKIIEKITTIGAIPILGVPPTKSSTMGDFLRTLPYTVVNFDYALTLNNDGVTNDPDLYNDNLHPNKYGQEKMFNQIKIDAPFLFD